MSKKYRQATTLLIILTLLLGIHYQNFAQKKRLPFDPKKQLSQFRVDVWDNEKGLPSATLLNIIQSKKGYLWIGSYDGLLRFDGNKFDIYNKQNVPTFKTNSVTKILESIDSTLWIGTQGSGLLSYRDGVFSAHGLEEEYVESIHQGKDPNLVYLGMRGGGLYVYNISDGDFTPLFKNELGKETIYDIAEYPSGKIWLATKKGVFVAEGASLLKVESEGSEIAVRSLYLDKRKNLWAGTYSGVWRYNGEKFVALFPSLSNERIHDIQYDPAGNLWIVGRNNIYRHNVSTKELELLTTPTGEAYDDVRSICIDTEDNLWIPAARHGLSRLQDGKFFNYTTREGISHPSINSVANYNDSLIIVGTSNGNVHTINFRKNKVSDFPIKSKIKKNEIFNIRQDTEGNVWIATYEGLLKKTPNGQEKLYTQKDGLPTDRIRLTFEDKKGRFWVGTRGGGLVEFSPDKETFRQVGVEQGFTTDFVMSIAQDNEGNLLVGSNNGGLLIEKNGVFKTYTTQNGLPTNLIFNIYCDIQNVLWLGTNTGLIRWENEKAFVFDGKQGLPNETIFDVVEDANGGFWLSSNNGVLQVSRQQLNDIASEKTKTLDWKQYDKGDGMASEQCKGATQSLLANDGTVWVPTNGGVVRINPNYLPLNRRRPPVYIQEVALDKDRILIEPKELTLPSDQKRLNIKFTALSLRAPEEMSFKYKLEGFDKDWVAVEDKREAVYTNLSAGSYVFKVIASNDDGVWNNRGASLPLRVKPGLFETVWFWVAVVLVLVILVASIIRLRTHRIAQKAKELEEVVAVRTAELTATNEELLTQQKTVDERNKTIEKQNHNIISSINYAKRIQVAMLPTQEQVDKLSPDTFILFLPRDIVSGDFYWLGEQNGKVIVAAVDCTGHGVPGAFMSLIGNDVLNKVIHDYSLTTPNLILNVLNDEVSNILKQRENENRDGMDVALWVWDKENQTIEFSGAKNPLIYIQDNKLYEIKGDKSSIGGGSDENKYKKHTIPINQDTYLYIFSDGFQDQFGGEENKKFMKKRLKELLLKNHRLPIAEQKNRLHETFQTWKNGNSQIDDVLVIGTKISV